MTDLADLGRLRPHWYVVARSKSLAVGRPRRVLLWSVPLVLWRDEDQKAVALIDRCPHRDVPLSRGTIRDGRIVCPYHGWEFEPTGRCAYAPALGRQQTPPAQRAAQALPVREQDGWIWVWLGEAAPSHEPLGLAAERRDGMRLVHLERVIEAPAIDVIENFVDSPHTPILHPGLVRGHREPTRRQVTVRVDADSVLVTHAPSTEKVGPVARLLWPGGAEVSHTDLFQLPAVVRVDYQFGRGEQAFLALIFATPETDQRTRAHIILGLRFGWLTRLLATLVPWVARTVLWQDARLLSWQTDNLRYFPTRSRGYLVNDRMHLEARLLWEAALAGRTTAVEPRTTVCELYV